MGPPVVILSDGDAVFQPRKVERSGLWQAFDDDVLIYIHKEEELDDVERLYPAKHYVLIDDKLRILDAVKKIWGERVTTVFPRQGTTRGSRNSGAVSARRHSVGPDRAIWSSSTLPTSASADKGDADDESDQNSCMTWAKASGSTTSPATC